MKPYIEKYTHALKNKLAMRGFTLIEIMLVVGLIAIFTAIGLGVGRNTNKQVEFFKDQAQITHAIYQAREYMSAIKGDACGYGIQLTRGSGATSTLAIVRVPQDAQKTCPTISRPPELEQTIAIQGLLEGGDFTILFMAPFGKQEVSGATPCIQLTSSDGAFRSVIKISTSGTPYIDSQSQTCN